MIDTVYSIYCYNSSLLLVLNICKKKRQEIWLPPPSSSHIELKRSNAVRKYNILPNRCNSKYVGMRRI